MTPDQQDRAIRFRALHEDSSVFIIPNPWDVGSARLLAGLGFQALATTSSGFAFSVGCRDGQIDRATMIAHVAAIAAATPLPVSADLENGYAHDPAKAAETLRLAAEAGAVGGSIEDYSCDEAGVIYEFDHAVERVAAAVETVRGLGFPFTLTARAEGVLRGQKSLDDTIGRLQAFEAAGADVLYAPGLKTIEEVRAVCQAVSSPVNVLAAPGLRLDELAAAGVRRISIGGALYRAAVAGMLNAVREMQDKGTFTWHRAATPAAEIAELMARTSAEPAS